VKKEEGEQMTEFYNNGRDSKLLAAAAESMGSANRAPMKLELQQNKPTPVPVAAPTFNV
jgi:hypothetical protein